jgi:hypothetical protein
MSRSKSLAGAGEKGAGRINGQCSKEDNTEEMNKERRSVEGGRKVESVEEFQGFKCIDQPHVTAPQRQYDNMSQYGISS